MPVRLLRRKVRDYVLVVGAAHIDVIADFSRSGYHHLDKIGSVRYSVGGTAYNVAINLGQMGVPAALLSVVKSNSFSSVWIRERLRDAGVSLDLVQRSTTISEAGFVAIRDQGHLVGAVTAAPIEGHIFPRERVEEAVRDARFVVVDCNLSQDQIETLLAITQTRRKPIIVAAVSDSKVSRLLQLAQHQSFDLVVMNQRELDALFQGRSGSPLEKVCDLVGAKQVVVTQGLRGYTTVRQNSAPEHHRAPEVETIVSRTGAGDALLSGVLVYWYRNQNLNFAEAEATVATCVRKVLGQPGSTVGALATDSDFSRLARFAVDEQPLFKRLFSGEVGVAVSIIVALLTVALLWLTYELRADTHHEQNEAPQRPQVTTPATPLDASQLRRSD